MNQPSRPPMLRSEARVATSRSERYAKQLCSHAAHMASRAEWTPPGGIIEFPGGMGTCRITSEPGHLVLALETADRANLDTLQQIISRDITRFASRESLTVQWAPPSER
jgi:hypothetical protein